MWWHDFFDDDALWLYGPTLDPERTEREVAGVVSMLRLKPGQKVLDLGCGAGRHAVPITRRGHAVTGIDWSSDALGKARERALDLDLEVPLVRGDLRALPFSAGRFDAAMSLFSTLGYESDEATLGFLLEARRVLRAGGKLVIEVLGRDFVVRTFQSAQEWSEVGGSVVRVRRWIDPVAGEERATFFFDRGGGAREKQFRRRLFTATELGALLRSAGFSKVEFFGDYERSSLRIDSPHLVALAVA